MKQHIFMLCAWVTLVLGVAIEARLMETPIEETVTDFELAEEGLSVVLTTAIEDARAMADYLMNQHDLRQREWFKANNEGREMQAAYLDQGVRDAALMQYRAVRILGLLQATREREAGRVT